jgi:hypothetical protein
MEDFVSLPFCYWDQTQNLMHAIQEFYHLAKINPYIFLDKLWSWMFAKEIQPI